MCPGVKGLKRIIESLTATFGLMSRIPVRSGHAADFTYTALFLPVVGVVVGLINFGVFALVGTFLQDGFLIAAIILIVQYVGFNLFHFDGFLDTMDALFVFASKEKRLSILKDIHIGAFGMFFGAVYLILKIYVLAKLAGLVAGSFALAALLFYYPVAGRMGASLLGCSMNPARPDGLGAAVGRFKALPTLLGIIIGLIFPLGSVFIFSVPLQLLIPLAGCLVAVAATYFVYRRYFGGLTGDGLGCVIEMAELLYIVIFLILVESPLARP